MNGLHQNTKRLAAVLDAVSAQAPRGVRQFELVDLTGLGKGTLHRILAGLVESDLLEFEAETSRYYIGRKVMSWASAGRMHNSMVDNLRPALDEIGAKTGDTVYLTYKHGNRATYVERVIGTYPLRSLPREIGEQRPLGIGAGPLAMLAGMVEDAREATLREIATDIRSYGISEKTLRALVQRSLKLGYALHDGEIQQGMVAIGLPLRKGPSIVGAISVAGTAERMPIDKHQGVIELVQDAVVSRNVGLVCQLNT
ncbi:IclR family transcriptional regulator [Stappia sp.]|uniref:IclR family transcriptional regulator n=1 Tax=Stappia sp. TaxID=1870903 RepID=UPI003A9A4D0C